MSETCFEIAKRLAGGKLTDDEVRDALDRSKKIRDRLIAAGRTDNLDAKVAQIVVAQTTKLKLAAAARRLEVAHNVVAYKRLGESVEAFKAAGLNPFKALRADMQGTQHPIPGARDSTARLAIIQEGRYI